MSRICHSNDCLELWAVSISAYEQRALWLREQAEGTFPQHRDNQQPSPVKGTLFLKLFVAAWGGST